MKKKCPVCGTRKGRRDCLIHGMEEICSLCCAEIRTRESCHTCKHFAASMKYEANRWSAGSAEPGKGHFLIEINPEVEEEVDRALGMVEAGNPDRALEVLRQLQGQHPHNHLVCYGLGTAHAVRGEHAEAIPHFSEAIEIYPYFVEAIYNRATAYREQLDIPKAIREFREVLEIADPSDIAARKSRGFLKDTAKIPPQLLFSALRSGPTTASAASLQKQIPWRQLVIIRHVRHHLFSTLLF